MEHILYKGTATTAGEVTHKINYTDRETSDKLLTTELESCAAGVGKITVST